MSQPVSLTYLSHTPNTLGPALASAQAYFDSAKASNTRRAYQADLRGFAAWCAARGFPSLPASPATVALYLAALADGGRKVSTIERALVAISQAHKLKGLPSPRSHGAVSETMKGIRRTLGRAPSQKSPVLVEGLRSMTRLAPNTRGGIRDKALLLIGFAGAFRRSELVGLNVEDFEFTEDGLLVALRRSKTDQEGEGRRVGIPHGSDPRTCPVRALRAWLDCARIAEGPAFRSVNRMGIVSDSRLSDWAVAEIVKRYARALGMDPSRFAGHSLRAGLATSAAKAGKSERAIMNQTGHRSEAMVRKYIREANIFVDNAAMGIGL